MSNILLLADDVRDEVERLIKSFDNHRCGFGYDVQAQDLLRVLLEVIDLAQGITDSGRFGARMRSD